LNFELEALSAPPFLGKFAVPSILGFVGLGTTVLLTVGLLQVQPHQARPAQLRLPFLKQSTDPAGHRAYPSHHAGRD